MVNVNDKEHSAVIKKELTLLFVDDDEVVLKSSVRMLKRRFKEVYTARDGKEGIEMFEKYFPDIVLTDIVMPNVDGIEMVSKIRNISEKATILTISAINEQSYIDKMEALGVAAYLIKPILEKQYFDLLYKLSVEICKKKALI